MRLPSARLVARSWIDRAAGLGVAALAALALSVAAIAAPPIDVDPSLAPWFQSLRQPGTGVSCCSIADCRMTDYRTTRSGYEALVGRKWLKVPPGRVLEHTTNPTGRAIVCYLPGTGILCFVRPAES
jgi:hypothetical protein